MGPVTPPRRLLSLPPRQAARQQQQVRQTNKQAAAPKVLDLAISERLRVLCGGIECCSWSAGEGCPLDSRRQAPLGETWPTPHLQIHQLVDAAQDAEPRLHPHRRCGAGPCLFGPKLCLTTTKFASQTLERPGLHSKAVIMTLPPVRHSTPCARARCREHCGGIQPATGSMAAPQADLAVFCRKTYAPVSENVF